MANMSQHERSKNGKDEWLTDPKIFEKLGGYQLFDLDPCAPIVRPWPMAMNHYTVDDDGLLKPWFGKVWCNPPYGQKTGLWMKLMAQHNNGIALIYARTDTTYWFPYIWDYASGIFWFKGRLQFYDTKGEPCKDKKGRIQKAGAPSVLVAYGNDCLETRKKFDWKGKLTVLKQKS